MANINIRNWVLNQLKPIVPKSWDLVPYGVAPAVINKPTVIITLTKVEPNAGNPRGSRLVSYALTLLEPTLNPGTAASALDDKLFDLLTAIDSNPSLSWSSCERGAVGQNVGWDVSLSVPVNINN